MNIISRVLAGGCIALLIVCAVTCGQLGRERQAHADAAFRASNAEARADTARRLAGLLGDTVAVWQRRAVQEHLPRDAVDQALRQESVARIALMARTPVLSRIVRSADTVRAVPDATNAVAGATTRSARFAVREVPYTIAADVALPAVGEGTMRVTVATDPASLGVRLTCGPAVDGIRPAAVAILAPPWLTIAIDRVIQDPDICRSPALAIPRRRWWDRLGLTIGYGLTIGRDGRVVLGPSVSAAVRLWP